MPPITKSLGRIAPRSISRSCHRFYSSDSPNIQTSSPAPGPARSEYRNRNKQAEELFQMVQANQTRTFPRRAPVETVGSSEYLGSIDKSKLTRAATREPNVYALQNASQRLDRRNQSAPVQQENLQMRRRIGRKWQFGDVYTPKDIGPSEQRKWLKKRVVTQSSDVFDMVGKSPAAFYKNFAVLTEFTTETGRIKHRKETGLKQGTQRKLAKAIRRAVGIGLIPSVHHHPMMIGRSAGLPHM
ncbi:hypothetical protein BT63DRAFT_460262 [Microthyrium microscopicum]|uniref:Small ribosomal subunit protein bS18m n=1 Tax=Microthyrium microscopicum TaxID=703497 RepID=A0A6A6TZM8_9PEZI|nr:hypothetical protein BT63DRAFT_460262 [Microthyrium microscopicum]